MFLPPNIVGLDKIKIGCAPCNIIKFAKISFKIGICGTKVG
jgi:hypothetical protein